jgi:hypothetical protein
MYLAQLDADSDYLVRIAAVDIGSLEKFILNEWHRFRGF